MTNGMEACLQELELFRSINHNLEILTKEGLTTFYEFKDEWTIAHIGNNYEFQKQVTLTGSAQDIDLNIPFALQLNRVSFFSDDDTAKSFSLRIYSGSVTLISYEELITVATNTNMSIVLFVDNTRYIQSPIRIRTAVSASTIGKILTIKVSVDKL